MDRTSNPKSDSERFCYLLLSILTSLRTYVLGSVEIRGEIPAMGQDGEGGRVARPRAPDCALQASHAARWRRSQPEHRVTQQIGLGSILFDADAICIVFVAWDHLITAPRNVGDLAQGLPIVHEL